MEKKINRTKIRGDSQVQKGHAKTKIRKIYLEQRVVGTLKGIKIMTEQKSRTKIGGQQWWRL